MKINKTFSLIGPGRLGASIAYNLVLHGWECRAIMSRSEKIWLRKIGVFKNVKITSSITDVINIGKNILIAVPDNSIKFVADEIACVVTALEKKIFLHFSGALGSDEMISLREKGSEIGSIHPLYSFPINVEKLPKQILFCFEGDKNAEFLAKSICSELKGIFFYIDKSKKALYHCGATIAGNMSLTLLYLAAELIGKALGEEREVCKESVRLLANSTLSNLKNSDWSAAMTGPIKRKDTETIKKHLSTLDENAEPKIKELYCILKKLTESILDEKQ